MIGPSWCAGWPAAYRAAWYQCTDTWYAGVYRCFDEKQKEVEEEGPVEEQRRKEKGRRKKKMKEMEKCSGTWEAAAVSKGSSSITAAKRRCHCSVVVVK